MKVARGMCHSDKDPMVSATAFGLLRPRMTRVGRLVLLTPP
jgi:hypothetical protein